MPYHFATLLQKRKSYFLEYVVKKREASRVDIYMEELKRVSGKQIYDIDDQDVLSFLIYKDINDSGRTVVHHVACPFIGSPVFDQCSDKVRCALRHQSESMRTGVVAKLRKAFEDVGRKGPYLPLTHEGDPTRSVLVREYMTFIRQEQGKTGVHSRSAKHIDKYKMDRFIKNLTGKARRMKKGSRRLRLKLRTAMYGYCYSAIKRLAGAGHVIAPNTIRMKDNKGMVCNCTWDKTLTLGKHTFGLVCVILSEPWCPHCLIDEWVIEAKGVGISFETGLLFPKLTKQGTVNLVKRWTSKELRETLKRDLSEFGLYNGETPHSFRHGGTVQSLKKGKSLEKTMCQAYMKSSQTVSVYTKGLRSIFPGFSWDKYGLQSEIDPNDEVALSLEMRSWKAFV